MVALLLQTVTYPKTRSTTGIRILLQVTGRGHKDVPGCNRWYFTFNGNKCTNPSTIEQVSHSSSGGNYHETMSSKYETSVTIHAFSNCGQFVLMLTKTDDYFRTAYH